MLLKTLQTNKKAGHFPSLIGYSRGDLDIENNCDESDVYNIKLSTGVKNITLFCKKNSLTFFVKKSIC